MPVLSAASGYMRTVRGLSRDARYVLASQAVVSVVNSLWGVLSNLYLLRLGYGAQFVGVANFAMLLGTAVSSLPCGLLSRRLTPRRSLVIGACVWAAAMAAYVSAWLLPEAAREPWLLTTALLYGASYALLAVSVSPLFMACVSSDQRGHIFALYHATGTTVSFVMSLVAGVLPGLVARAAGVQAEAAGAYGMSLLIGPALLLVSAALVTRARPPAEAAEEPWRGATALAPAHAAPRRAPMRLFLAVSAVLLVGWMGQGTVLVFWNVYLDQGLHLSTPLIGTISAIMYTVAIPAALSAPVAMERLGANRTYPLALVACAASLTLLGLLPGAGVAAFALAMRHAAFSVSSPTITAISQSSVPARWRGAMAAVVNLALTVGRGVTALAGGLIVATAGYRPLFVVGAVLVVAAAAMFWFWVRRLLPADEVMA